MRGHSNYKNEIFFKGVWYVIKNKIRELEKEIRNTKSYKRKKDLYKHLKRLLKVQNYDTKNVVKKTKNYNENK